MSVLNIISLCLFLQVASKINALQCALCNGGDELCPQLLIAECPPERNNQCVDVYFKPTGDYPKGRLEKFCTNKYYTCTVPDGICSSCLGNLCNSETTLDSYYKRYINTSNTNKDASTSSTTRNVMGVVLDDVLNKYKVHIPSAGGTTKDDAKRSNDRDATNVGIEQTASSAGSTTSNSGFVSREDANKISGGGTAEGFGVVDSDGGTIVRGILSEILELSGDSTTETAGGGNKGGTNNGGVGIGFRLSLGKLGGIKLSLGTVGNP